ncbi:glucosyltransferase domain-containing protein [Pseudomonas sp. COR18]|uniref:glucosyltransferase domain-containing protein n=1 Tax=Pseudomonas sp. COR18 TaxID=3399680 RepID=UPI003B004D38
MSMERVLTRREIFVFFIVASLVYVYPIVRADYAYIDDSWRSLLMFEEGWRQQGRILIEIMHRVLTFTNSMPNTFPMPLLLTLIVLAQAMTSLTLRYFPLPRFWACLVVLPILCSPFFLGNLTYQYDGPGMLLGVSAVLYAITLRVEGMLLQVLLSGVLVAVSLAFYQLNLSLFIGLCCVELMWSVRRDIEFSRILATLVSRVFQLLLGGALYFFTAYQLIDTDRGRPQALDWAWWGIAWGKLVLFMEQVKVLVTPGNRVVVFLLLAIALLGFIRLLGKILTKDEAVLKKTAVTLLYLLCVPVLMVSLPGAMLFIDDYSLDARDLVSFSAILVFLMLLAYHGLGCVWVRARWLLAVPVLLMFSLSYAYGQILIAKKELEFAMAQYISYDLASRVELRALKRIYRVGPETGGNWLPRGYGAMTLTPVLRFILSDSSVVLHTEFFPRLGMNNVVEGDRERFFGEAALPPELIVDNKFYAIYRVQDNGVILMKEITDSEDYREQRRLP